MQDSAAPAQRHPPPAIDPKERELGQAYDIIRAFADRAFRRPVTHEEVIRLLRFVEVAQQNGDGFEQGLKSALRAILISPQFLFRFELDEEGGQTGKARQVSDFELASRLSYFLWSSMPDPELFRLAAQGTASPERALS